jgi:hypothetical protein
MGYPEKGLCKVGEGQEGQGRTSKLQKTSHGAREDLHNLTEFTET